MHQLAELGVTLAAVDGAGFGDKALAAHAAAPALSVSASRPKALCSTRTASSVYSSGISTLTLISDVVMARILIRRSASASNICAAMPALERMPTPTALTLAISMLVM